MPDYSWPDPQHRKLLGTRQTRVDGPVKVTGRAKYTYDLVRPGMLYGVMVRSPHAHARITAIDTSAAEKMPGVKAVHRVVKEGDELYYAGDEVLALAADTEEHARDAARAIKVGYKELDHVVAEDEVLKDPDKKTTPGPLKGKFF